MRRPRLPILLFALLFCACVFGAWAWFNVDSGPRPSTFDAGQQPRLWLVARTNIPGYIFIPEPVSDQVMKTLGTTNILSGTFYEIGDCSPQTETIQLSLEAD